MIPWDCIACRHARACYARVACAKGNMMKAHFLFKHALQDYEKDFALLRTDTFLLRPVRKQFLVSVPHTVWLAAQAYSGPRAYVSERLALVDLIRH